MPHRWKAKWIDIGYFLKGFRIWRGEMIEVVAKRYQGLLREFATDQAVTELNSASRRVGASSPGDFLEKLEGQPFDQELSRVSVRLLARAYKLPALMLDFLFSNTLTAEHYCLVRSLQEFDKANDDSDSYGTCIDYRIPPDHLAHCQDIAFGHLDLQPDGESAFHDHPGTELLLLLDGDPIELCLETTGVRIPIQKGQFVHFRSEMPHSARHSGTGREGAVPASVFVIRFYQLFSNSTRHGVLKIAQEVIKTLQAYERGIRAVKRRAVEGKLKEVKEQIEGLPTTVGSDHRRLYKRLSNLIESLTKRVNSDDLRQLRDKLPEHVADHFGLALMLERIREKKGWNITHLQNSGGFTRNRLFEILLAKSPDPLSRDELYTLADQFGVEPMLLYSFMYPSDPDVVTGRLLDMATVPENLTGDGVTYRIPRCNLALSDMNLLIVDLGPGRATKANQHPGTELAIPLDGTIGVKFEGNDPPVEISSEQRQYAHYSSEKKHQLVNLGMRTAQVFIARFYGWSNQGKPH